METPESVPGYVRRSHAEQLRHDALVSGFAVSDRQQLFRYIAAHGVGWHHWEDSRGGIRSKRFGQ